MPRLDVETDEERRERLGNLFSSLSSPSTAAETPFPMPPPSMGTFAMPESDALVRARAFLPLLAASNAELAARQQRGEDVAIDGVLDRVRGEGEEDGDEEGEAEAEGEGEDGDGEGTGPAAAKGRGEVVEMDVGVGVFDVRGDVVGDVGPVVEREAGVWAGEGGKEKEKGKGEKE